MRDAERGMTYLELVATATIMMVLASAILPLGRVAYRRTKEMELRRNLRSIRLAINAYYLAAKTGGVCGTDLKLGSEGYPEDLDKLVEGVKDCMVVPGSNMDRKLKFLRRLPVDPMTGEAEWGKRCYQDAPDSTSWCGENVWDVYSLSKAKALDGTTYNTW